MRILSEADFSDVKVEPDRLWCLAGYSDPSRASRIMNKALERAMEMGAGLLEPVACYDMFPIEKVTSSSVDVDSISFESQDLAFRFREARELAVLIVTIGPRLENQVEELNASGDAGGGLVLDMYGSIAVDQVAYKAREIIQKAVLDKGYRAMSYGYCIGKNCRAYTDCGGVVAYWLAPGYADLETREQKKVFTLVDGRHIGVHLSESCMMTPRKSYACLLPIGPQVEKVSNPCNEGEKDWIVQGSLVANTMK